MTNISILSGLKLAVSRGETLQQAMQSFYNAGYKKEEIQEAARDLLIEQKRELKPVAKSEEKPEIIQKISKYEEEKPEISKTIPAKPKPAGYGLVIVLIIVLEIGAGLGINLKTAAESGVKKENIFSCDINKEAARHCKSLGFNCVQSDLFEKIKGKFNIIIFNPPYLPEDKREPLSSKIATTGGKLGGETINIFLKQTKSYLKQDGRIFLITSTQKKAFFFLGYEKKLLEKKNFFPYYFLSIPKKIGAFC